MKKYEYLQINHDLTQDELNALGEQGWELISYYVKEYDIYIDGSYLATSIATTFTADGLTASTTYSFSVLARDTSDNISTLSGTFDGTTTETLSGASELFIYDYLSSLLAFIS